MHELLYILERDFSTSEDCVVARMNDSHAWECMFVLAFGEEY